MLTPFVRHPVTVMTMHTAVFRELHQVRTKHRTNDGSSASVLHSLQRVHKNLARTVLRAPFSSANALNCLRDLHWLPIGHRYHINLKLASICYRSVHNHQPSYLSQLLNDYKPDHVLRSATNQLLIEPLPKPFLLHGVFLALHLTYGIQFQYLFGLLSLSLVSRIGSRLTTSNLPSSHFPNQTSAPLQLRLAVYCARYKYRFD